jgi:hypothetical protein
LYRFYQVPALRATQNLESYIKKRYPKWRLSSLNVSQLLYHTGGIGRWINDCWTETEYTIKPDNNGEYSFLLLEQLRKCTTYRKISPEHFIETEDERKLIVLLSEFTAPIFHQHINQRVSCGGMDRSFLLGKLSTAGVKSPTSVIYNAQAYGVIYVDNVTSMVQFALPLFHYQFLHFIISVVNYLHQSISCYYLLR